MKSLVYIHVRVVPLYAHTRIGQMTTELTRLPAQLLVKKTRRFLSDLLTHIIRTLMAVAQACLVQRNDIFQSVLNVIDGLYFMPTPRVDVLVFVQELAIRGLVADVRVHHDLCVECKMRLATLGVLGAYLHLRQHSQLHRHWHLFF